ncbi:unnamed protein product, partial [Nesidiocoris tenuis]
MVDTRENEQHDDQRDCKTRPDTLRESKLSSTRKMEMEIRRDMLEVVMASFQGLQNSINEQISSAVEKFQRLIENLTLPDENDEEQINEDLPTETRQELSSGEELPKNEKRKMNWADEVEEEEKRSWRSEKKSSEVKKRGEKLQFPINLDCKLSEDTDYGLWRDKIVSEIQAQDCMFIIDGSVQSAQQIEKDDLAIIKQKVRCFIIRHLDESHHKLVQNENDPLAVMQKLDQKGDPSSNYTEFSLMKRLIETRYDPCHESVTEFLANFDDLVNRIRRHTELPDKQIKMCLLIAVNKAFPSIQLLDQSCKGGLTIAEIKSRLYENENHNRDVLEVENPGASRAMFGASSKRTVTRSVLKTAKRALSSGGRRLSLKRAAPPLEDVTCYQCGKQGHYKENCKSRGRLCYNCNKISDHVSASCPERKNNGNEMQKVPTTGTSQSKKMNQSGTTRKFPTKSKIPFKTAQKIDRDRRKAGRAQLTVRNDSETESLPEDERLCYIDVNDLNEEENQLVFYSSTRPTGDSDEPSSPNKLDGQREESKAYSTFK